MLAGRACCTVGDQAAKSRYAELIKSNLAHYLMRWCGTPSTTSSPKSLHVDDLRGPLYKGRYYRHDWTVGFAWQSADLVNRLDSRPDLERLLEGLMEQVGQETDSGRFVPEKGEEALFPPINAAACRLLEQCSTEDAPMLVINASLWLGRVRRHIHPYRKVKDVNGELHRTAARRQAGVLAVGRVPGRPPAPAGPDTRLSLAYEMPWDIRTGLLGEDLDWLLADGPGRVSESERRLAINAAIAIWRGGGFARDNPCTHRRGCPKRSRDVRSIWDFDEAESEVRAGS